MKTALYVQRMIVFVLNPALPNPTTIRDVKDLIVQRCVIWNAEPGNAIEIGYGLMCQEITKFNFSGTAILVHCQYEGNMGGSAMSIHQADNAYIHNIHYENIRVEDVLRNYLILKCWSASIHGRRYVAELKIFILRILRY